MTDITDVIERLRAEIELSGPHAKIAAVQIADLSTLLDAIEARGEQGIETDADGEAMICTGCGTTRTMAAIKAVSKTAYSCCPERKMVPAREVWRPAEARPDRTVEARELLARELDREDFTKEAALVRVNNNGLSDLDIDWVCAIRAIKAALQARHVDVGEVTIKHIRLGPNGENYGAMLAEALAAEKERCAKIAGDYEPAGAKADDPEWFGGACEASEQIAAAIRSQAAVARTEGNG